MKTAHRRLKGQIEVGGQEHLYLEGHIAFALPGEDDDVVVHCSTQHPSEAQHMVAHVLGVPSHSVVVNVRRMGGGFGGKESQMNPFACIAAIAAKRFDRPVKIRPDRDQDMSASGKRHDFFYVVTRSAMMRMAGSKRLTPNWLRVVGFPPISRGR